MPRELINVGVEPNDGTGDPPRVAGQKINANFEELYLAVDATETETELDARDTANRARANHTGTQAISTVSGLQTALDAKLEAGALTDLSTSDAAQDTAIAALVLNDEVQDTAITGLVNEAVGLSGEIETLATTTTAALATKLEAPAIASFETTTQLNARDVANRARGSHTGTQPANTVSGLATVATSGAYADLSGKPTISYGFTYDQQAEPSSPVVGETWRERSSGGLIVGEWEWSGSLWLSSERYAPLYYGVLASANTSAVMAIYPKYPVLLTGYTASFTQPFAPQDSSNHWLFRHGGLTLSSWLNTIDQSTTIPTSLQQLLATPVVITGPTASDNFVSRVGSPGNLRHFQVITHYKLIRS